MQVSAGTKKDAVKRKFGEDGCSFPAGLHQFGFPGTVSVLLVQVLVFIVQ